MWHIWEKHVECQHLERSGVIIARLLPHAVLTVLEEMHAGNHSFNQYLPLWETEGSDVIEDMRRQNGQIEALESCNWKCGSEWKTTFFLN